MDIYLLNPFQFLSRQVGVWGDVLFDNRYELQITIGGEEYPNVKFAQAGKTLANYFIVGDMKTLTNYFLLGNIEIR